MQVIEQYEGEICELYPQVAQQLETLKSVTVDTVRQGAQLGAYLNEASKRHKDQLWTWLQTLPVGCSHNVIAFAQRAYKHSQRHPELDDASQLTFALALDQGRAEGNQRPQRHGFDVVDVVKPWQRAVIAFRKLEQTKPVGQWSKAEKQGLREIIEPLWRALGDD